MFFFVFLCFRCFPRACGQVFPPISPQKWGEIILYLIFLIAYMIIVIWENRGNREKSQDFRGFAAFLLLGKNWHKGRKGRFSAAFPVFPDSFALRCVRCLRIIGNFPRVYFCQALRRAIVAACLLPSIYFCQAIARTHTHARGGTTTLVFWPPSQLTPKFQPDEFDEKWVAPPLNPCCKFFLDFCIDISKNNVCPRGFNHRQ